MWDNSILKEIIRHSDSVLDLGCGNKMSYNGLVCRKYVGVDIWENARADVMHDLRHIPYPFDNKSFDVVTALDCIEHLEKDEGKRMLEEMERIARRIMVIFTPEEFRDNRENVYKEGLWSTGNTYNIHHSLWSTKDFVGWDTLTYTDPGYLFYKKTL
ncbi:MAG: methyltransferase domain-containing protein [Candidatus Altiarchaeales archaeon]|nr:methyltransferase domain-containing protein [Candidatus Altiarchaeales archaeon]